MLRSVAEISDLTGLSKVSIYNKLKLKDIAPFVVKVKGITYIDEDGFNLINKSLNNFISVNDEVETINETDEENNFNLREDIENKDIEEFKDELKQLKESYKNSLNDEILNLRNQIEKKDKQIEKLINLNENNQVLLKQQQDKEIKTLQLEQHFAEIDEKLLDLREKMESKKQPKKNFFKFFKK